MKVLQNPDRNLWPDILQRPVLDAGDLEKQVRAVMQAVREKGDAALREYTQRFDGVNPDRFLVSAAEIKAAKAMLPGDLCAARFLNSDLKVHNIRFLIKRKGLPSGKPLSGEYVK